MRKLLVVLGVLCLISFIFRDRANYDADEIIEAKEYFIAWEGNHIYEPDEYNKYTWSDEYTMKEPLNYYGRYHENEVRELSELESLSDVIVEVEMISSKEVGTYRFIELEIIDVYKGDDLLDIGEVVNLVERKGYCYLHGNFIGLYSPFIPMEKNQKYVAFLNPIDGYNTKHFSFTSTTFSRFLRQDEACVKTVTIEQEEVSRDWMENCQVLYVEHSLSDEYYQKYPEYYLKIQREIMEKYK